MSNITIVAVAAAVIVVLVSVIAVAGMHRKQRRIMDSIEEMLETARKGSFKEQDFDESRFSALENRFADYLLTSEISAERVKNEKEKIKTLISDISHQTKTPIANIQLYSELLDEMELPQSAKEYTFQLHTQTEKLSFLITSLVKLSRLETGIVALHPENGSISQLAEEVAASYMEKAAAKGLKLSVQPAEDCQGVFDRKWTAEALGNIIDNGIKYTNSGSVIVSVKRYEMFVCIEISDTGIGIQEQEMSQVFTRFYRGKDTRARRCGNRSLSCPGNHLGGGRLYQGQLSKRKRLGILRIPAICRAGCIAAHRKQRMKSYRTVMICFLLEIMWKDYFDIICMKGAKERLFRTDFF